MFRIKNQNLSELNQNKSKLKYKTKTLFKLEIRIKNLK